MNKLYRLKDDSFLIKCGTKVAASPNVSQLVPIMVQMMFPEEAIVASLMSLANMDHSVAHFGLHRTFLYSE